MLGPPSNGIPFKASMAPAIEVGAQPQKVKGMRLVFPAECCESEPNALVSQNLNDSVIMIPVGIAKDRQDGPDLSFEIFLRSPNLLAHSVPRYLGHDGMCSCVRSNRKSFFCKRAQLVPGQDAPRILLSLHEFSTHRINQSHRLIARDVAAVVLDF